jgi:hypothetical protein
MMFVKAIAVLTFATLSLAAPIVDRMFCLIIMPLNKPELNRLHAGNAEPGPLAVPRRYGPGVRDDSDPPECVGTSSECLGSKTGWKF